MATIPHKGYLGSCSIAGANLACTSMSVGYDLKPGFYDHVIGLKDTNSSGSKGKGGHQDVQKHFWRWTPGVAKVSVSGVGTPGALESLWDAAFKGDEISAGCTFWKGGTSKGVSEAYISNLTIDCQAGDNMNFSVEVIGKKLTGKGGNEFNCSRLVTWIDANVGSSIGEVYGFSISINNPIKPVWTSNEGYFADDLRIGIQEITGSVTCLDPYEINESGNGQFSIKKGCNGGINVQLNVVYHGTQNATSPTGIFLSTTPFTAVT